MSRKQWATMSEDTLHRGVAALSFLRDYTFKGMGQGGFRLAHGRLSKFAVERQILLKPKPEGSGDEETVVGFCLGAADWSALFWPVKELVTPEFVGLFLDPRGEAQWVNILRPDDWFVLEVVHVVHNDAVYMVPTNLERPLPLLKFFFGKREHERSLNIQDLTLLAESLGIIKDWTPSKMVRREMLHKLVDCVGKDDPEWVSKVKADMEQPAPKRQIGDSLDELVLSELPLQEQRDFVEVADEVASRRKAGWSIVQQKVRDATAQKRPKSKAKPKGSAKPRAVKAKAFVLNSRKRKRQQAEAPADDDRPSPRAEPARGPAVPEPDLVPDLVPEPVQVGVPDDTPLADLLPQQAAAVPAAVEEGIAAAPNPVRPRRPPNVWVEHACPHCGKPAGQTKYDPHPGSRDPPCWFMRVWLQDGTLPNQGRFFRRRSVTVVGDSDEFAINWVVTNRKCCG